MLPGFSGQLVSESFLESRLAAGAEPFDGAEAGRVRRRLASWRRRCQSLGPASSVRSLFELGAAPLVEALGFDPPRNIEPGQPSVPRARAAAVRRRSALIVASWGERLDPLWRAAVTHAIRRGSSWCLLHNGTHLRIVDARRPYARRYAEFDVDLAIEDDRAFAAFWWMMRADRFAIAEPATIAPLHAIVEASERHASGVCRSLKDGVLAASTDVLGALVGGRREWRGPLGDSLEQALTIVYRLLFLLFAEARGLVPLWHPVYRESYSVEALRDAAEQDAGGTGLWDALRAIARLAHAGCRAGDLRVTPFNGRLFAPSRTPLADRRDLDDAAARRAVLALSTRAAPGRRRPRTDRVSRPRRRAARRRLRDAARLRAARSDRAGTPRVARRARWSRSSRAPASQGDRNVLHAAADRRLPGPPDARTARAGCDARSDPQPADCRSGDGQRRVSRRRVPVSGRGVRNGAHRAWRLPRERLRRARARVDSTDDRRALPVRRGPQSDGGAARAALAVARHARRRPAADVSRSPSSGRRQPAWDLAVDACAAPPAGKAREPDARTRRRPSCSTTATCAAR